MAFAVSQRRQEIGIRMALGADRRSISRWVLGEGLMLALVGIAIGLIGAAASGKLLGGLAWGVNPNHPALFAGTLAVLLAVALGACLLPARRAAGVDPVRALRAN